MLENVDARTDVQTDGRTDNGTFLYYKLTMWAFGSEKVAMNTEGALPRTKSNIVPYGLYGSNLGSPGRCHLGP